LIRAQLDLRHGNVEIAVSASMFVVTPMADRPSGHRVMYGRRGTGGTSWVLC
jgi:hypothetical protein